MASVCPAWRANVTSSSATTRPPPPPSPRPLPNACRSPSAESIDARRQIVHVERLHEVARVSQVEHGDQRLHAHVGGRHDHGECGVGGADLLQQGDAVGVGETEIEHQHFGAELFELAPRLGAAPGEGDVVPRGEAPIVRPPQRCLVLDEQHLAPRRGGGGPHGGAIYAGDPRRPRRPRSGRAALQLEQVVQFGKHKEKAQLLVRSPQAHRQAAFRRLALNQHQRAQTRAVHLPRSRQVDRQPPGPLLELLQQLPRGAAERRARIETQLFGGGQDSFAWARRHRHHVLHGQLQKSPRLELCDSDANLGPAELSCGSPTGCQSPRENPHAPRCRRPSGAAHIARRRYPPSFTENRPACTMRRADRKSTRLNSSHGYISYAVFCLKKKKKIKTHIDTETLPGLCQYTFDCYWKPATLQRLLGGPSTVVLIVHRSPEGNSAFALGFSF